MDIFLRLKHWQLFLLVVVLPIFLPSDPATSLPFFFITMILVGGVIFGWVYSLGINLHKKLPQSVLMNLRLFKWMIFISLVYISAISLYTSQTLSSSGQQFNTGIFALIFTLHLFVMFCLFYCLHFIAKSLKALELRKHVTFSDYAGEFFLIWFFPFGIWFIQPRINKLFDSSL